MDVEREDFCFLIFPFVEMDHEPIYHSKREARWFVISVHDAGLE
jgi:hypothetical protein